MTSAVGEYLMILCCALPIGGDSLQADSFVNTPTVIKPSKIGRLFGYRTGTTLQTDMMYTAVISLLLAFCLILHGPVRRRFAFWQAKRRTGCYEAKWYPHRDPIFGYDLYKRRQDALKHGYLMKIYSDDFDRLGKTWQEKFLTQRVINTKDAENIQTANALAFDDYVKWPSRTNIGFPFMGHGILNSDGPRWRHSRELIRPIFARDEIANIPMLKSHVDRFVDGLSKDGSTFDIQPLFKKLLLDLSTEFLFGQSVGAQTAEGSAEADRFLKALNDTLLGWNKRRQAGAMAFKYTFDKSWEQSYSKVHQFLDKHVQRALEMTEEGKSTGEEHTPSDRHYVLLHEMAKQIRDPLELRSQVLNVFLPSRDTIAVLLSNVMFQLARHPYIWTDLRTCALAIEHQVLDFSVLKSLLPFRYVLHETLRHTGPSGRSFRTARVNTTLPRGGGPDGRSPIFVPKGTTVCSALWHLHHSKDIWGDDADEFKPSRWRGRRVLWDFVPFLGGPRICPAQQQVFFQATYVLVRLTLAFESIENRDPVLEYVELARMLTESRNGVKIALKGEKTL